jgi:hypothetical protein
MLPRIPPYLSTDVTWDIFMALTRDEIEKCQLVNLAWKSLISSRYSSLPLRKFFALTYWGPMWKLRVSDSGNFMALQS